MKSTAGTRWAQTPSPTTTKRSLNFANLGTSFSSPLTTFLLGELRREIYHYQNHRQINLWIDSADLKLIGKNSTFRKDDTWSYKENGPAQRYMFVQMVNPDFVLSLVDMCLKLMTTPFCSFREIHLNEYSRMVLLDSLGKMIFDSIEFVVPFLKPIGRPKKGQHKDERMLELRNESCHDSSRVALCPTEESLAGFGYPSGMVHKLKTTWYA